MERYVIKRIYVSVTTKKYSRFDLLFTLIWFCFICVFDCVASLTYLHIILMFTFVNLITTLGGIFCVVFTEK